MYVLIVPIRDGNTILSPAYKVHLNSFDCSYKGWKLRLIQNVLQTQKRFDCSYKGWKPDSPAFTSDVVERVLIVPIRDGNSILACTTTKA